MRTVVVSKTWRRVHGGGISDWLLIKKCVSDDTVAQVLLAVVLCYKEEEKESLLVGRSRLESVRGDWLGIVQSVVGDKTEEEEEYSRICG